MKFSQRARVEKISSQKPYFTLHVTLFFSLACHKKTTRHSYYGQRSLPSSHKTYPFTTPVRQTARTSPTRNHSLKTSNLTQHNDYTSIFLALRAPEFGRKPLNAGLCVRIYTYIMDARVRIYNLPNFRLPITVNCNIKSTCVGVSSGRGLSGKKKIFALKAGRSLIGQRELSGSAGPFNITFRISSGRWVSKSE